MFIFSKICIIHLRKIFRFLLFWFYKIFQIWGIIDGMGTLENFENAWDPEFQYESTPIVERNNMGEPILIEQGLDEEVLYI